LAIQQRITLALRRTRAVEDECPEEAIQRVLEEAESRRQISKRLVELLRNIKFFTDREKSKESENRTRDENVRSIVGEAGNQK
jgi:hypothetical protein